VALFAVSYDSLAILRDFAAAHGIDYPLLSDEGSHVMRALGLINERVQEDHAAYGIAPNPRHVNLPYPGVVVLDEAGAVVQKRFFESYRERDTGSGLVAQVLGIVAEPASAMPVTEGVVKARGWLDSPTYAFFQRLVLTVELAIAPGFHVYGETAQDGLTSLAVEIGAIDGLEVGVARWPAGDLFEGVVRGTLPLTFAAPPGGGDHTLDVTVHFQACDDGSCLVPAMLRLQVPIREAPLVGRTLPAPGASPAPAPPATPGATTR
jgi:hypothetical protein